MREVALVDSDLVMVVGKLELHEGDFLLLRVPCQRFNEDLAKLARRLSEATDHRHLVVVMPDDLELSAINRAGLREVLNDLLASLDRIDDRHSAGG